VLVGLLKLAEARDLAAEEIIALTLYLGFYHFE
jgi:hypothetical protein